MMGQMYAKGTAFGDILTAGDRQETGVGGRQEHHRLNY